MKKNLFFLFSFLCMVLMLSGCQVYGLIKDASDKEEGQVIMKDGQEFVGRVETPNSNTKKLTIITGKDEKQVLEADKIEALVMWKKTHPEIKHVLRYIRTYWRDKKQTLQKPMWMAVTDVGDHVVFYTCSFNYSIPSDGSLKITSVKGGSIYHYAQKDGDDFPHFVSMSDMSKRQVRKKLIDYLGDDPVLVKKLTEQEIKPLDFETIAEEYKPQ
ncbi:MAG: hypothetical protein ACOYJK_07665 [Prevotella sp.]